MAVLDSEPPSANSKWRELIVSSEEIHINKRFYSVLIHQEDLCAAAIDPEQKRQVKCNISRCQRNKLGPPV